jgi:periplasmic protein TonB
MDNELLKNEAITLEEIVFENRNKEYGAYVLRKKFRKFLMIAFLISLFSVFSAILVPYIQAYNNRSNLVILLKNTVVNMENVKAADDIPPPPPPPPPPPAAAEQQVKYVAPVVVDSVKVEVQLATVSEATETTTNEPVPDKIEVVKEAETAIVEEEPVFIVVEEQASFQGGDVNSFREWVTKNLKYPPIAAENGISGKVYIQYAVNSKGDVVDVKVVRGVDPSLDKEAVRVIMSSPKWEPAKQRGVKVKQQFTIPIAFILQ